MLRDHAVEGLHVLQRPAHQHRIPHAHSVIGEDPDPGPGIGHRAEFRKTLARQTDGHRAYRTHLGPARFEPQRIDLFDDSGGIGHRGAVGHRVDRGESAPGRRLGPGEHGFGVFPAGLPQMGVQIDQAGQRHQAVRIDHDRAGRVDPVAGLQDHAVADQEVTPLPAERLRAPD